MLQAHPDMNVITGADQAITGALQAVPTPASRTRSSSSATAVARSRSRASSGRPYGTVMQAPATEGAGHRGLHRGDPDGHARRVDVLANLPDGGVVTSDNVDTFLPLAEWPG